MSRSSTPLQSDGEIVSSSRIRQLVADGEVGIARRMLSAPYRLRGIVTHGDGRGSKLGFPTANLVGIDTLLPAVGVYAGRGWVDGRSWAAAINIGPNPTFGVETLKVEAHLVGRTIRSTDGWSRSIFWNVCGTFGRSGRRMS